MFRKGKGGEEGGEEQGMAVEELEAVVVKEEGDNVIALLSLFNAVRSSTSDTVFIKVVGSGIASLLLAVGFRRQLVLMCKTRSSQGLSLGLPLLDVTGSSLSILVLCLEAKEEGDDVNVGGMVPYAIIVGFQVLVIVIALVIFPDPNRFTS
ncbi:hypothetical protein VYU27_000461 [Nannochloropsis oceanica]